MVIELIQPVIFINNTEISELYPLLKKFSFTDNTDEADTAELTFFDEERKFMRGLIPRDSKIKLQLRDGNLQFDCGIFELDKIGCKGVPSECTFKLNSVSNSAGLRGTEKNKAWENTNLKKIAGDIASESGLTLLYEAEEISINRAEQNSSDLSFLKKLCKNHGLNLKIYDGKLIIFDAKKYEDKAAVGEIFHGDNRLLSYSFDANAVDIYSTANTNFSGGGSVANWLLDLLGIDDLISTSFDSGSSGNVLTINEKVDSLADAEKLSQSKLREKNKNEWTANLNLAGNFDYAAGNNLELSDFGIYSGKYCIDTATHSLSNGYTTQLKLHKVLNY